MALDRPIIASAMCLVALLIAACGGETKKVQFSVAPAPLATSETSITSAPLSETRVSPSIAVSDEIARTCRLQFDDLSTAPKFDFDKSDLMSEDRAVLATIGECVTTGPLRGRTMVLVGRADPRGTQQYNMALGARRARSVAAVLEQLGVDPAHIRETSRGELDSSGADEVSWLIDRRVDILLAF